MLNRLPRKHKILASIAILLALTANYFIGGSEEVDRLLVKLNKGKPAHKVEAANELGRMGTSASGAVDDLRLYVRSPDGPVRRAAASALLRIDRDEAIDAFLWAFRDPNAGVRMDAAEALERSGSKKALEIVNRNRVQHSVKRQRARIQSWAESVRRERQKEEKKRYKRHRRIYGAQ